MFRVFFSLYLTFFRHSVMELVTRAVARVDDDREIVDVIYKCLVEVNKQTIEQAAHQLIDSIKKI